MRDPKLAHILVIEALIELRKMLIRFTNNLLCDFMSCISVLAGKHLTYDVGPAGLDPAKPGRDAARAL